jgi:hypothetical protein
MPAKRFPIRGGFYALTDRHWSQQDVLNLIPVPAETSGTKTEYKLDSYGLRPFVEIGTGAIRGLHNVEGKFFAVSGTQLYQILDGVAIPRGNIPGVGRVSMAHNQYGGGHQLVIDNGAARYVYNDVTLVLEKVTDASFPGSFCAFYVDQYLGFVEPQGRYWGHSDLADATDYNSLDTYEAEADPDRIVWAHVSHREVLIFGQDTIEPYVNAPVGDGTAPFQRAANTVIEYGLGAKFSVQSMDSATFFLDDKRQVRELRGYQTTRISNAGVEEALAECSPESIARAYAFTWQHGPHKVYYLTVPGHFTFGFDLLTREWHRRSSPGKPTWRLSSLEFWNGQWVGGDASTGKLYTIDADYCFDGTEELEREYRPGVLFADQRGIEVNEIEVLITPGNPTVEVAAFPEQPEGPTIDGPETFWYRVGDTIDLTWTATGGTLPYTFTVRPGGDPLAGGTLASDGEMTGTTTTVSEPAFTVRVTDANGLWDEMEVTGVVAVDVTLITDARSYGGDRDDLIAGPAMGWHANIDRVKVSPDGLLAFGWSVIHPPQAVEFRRYDPTTQTWSLLTNPGTMPSYTSAAAWHPDGVTVTVGTGDTAPANLLRYRVSGGTVTLLAAPAVALPNESVLDLHWDDDGGQLVIAKANSGEQFATYDLTADALVNRTLFGDGSLDSPVTVRFAPGSSPRYIAGSHAGVPKKISLYDVSGVAALAASLSLNGKRGVFFDADGSHLFTVSDGDGEVGTDYVRVVSITGGVGSEVLAVSSTPATQPSADPSDAAMSRDGTYLAVAVDSESTPIVYAASVSATPRTLTPTTAEDGGTNISALDWTGDGE